jgi:hypothetical protein
METPLRRIIAYKHGVKEEKSMPAWAQRTVSSEKSDLNTTTILVSQKISLPLQPNVNGLSIPNKLFHRNLQENS